MPRTTQKTKLETAQEKLKTAATTPETIKIDPTSINANSTHQASVFNPSDYLASNLFADTSTLPRTSKVEADKAIQSISEKRETLRLVSANLSLNTDAYKAGSLSEKMSQASITWQTDRIGTDTKLVGLENAKVLYQTATVKLAQTGVKLEHENVTLGGLTAETEQRQRFWAAKYELAETRIRGIIQAQYSLDQKIGSIEAEAESIE
ncbi:hypothetical protein [Anabaena lutea]|uniref:TolC family protein n=1 Tax=Anabaena lutea FACHB-196 TaxID=2692881 RepID=A0ABR8FRN1_9NOST|nr:hypothetical protein [Anabaena lutea]MBD2571376.1 hypothetical protein [Anabaena lutea FACHB-196]